MIKLPKTKDPKETHNICKCRPICKSRRREWKGKTLHTSAELLLERKPLDECVRRWPMKVYPNSPCPLFAKSHHVAINERYAVKPTNVVRLCLAPIDDTAHTPYLRYAELAQRIGAWAAVRARCPFCECCACCPCVSGEYLLHDAERKGRRRGDMREFDARVKTDYQTMRIMYDKP